MDAFSYLSVLLSIILGLGITQILQGYRGLLLSRRRVRLYAPPLIWSGLLLLFAAQSWWASFGLADHAEWTFQEFAVVLLQMVLLYMMTAVVLPDPAPDTAIDLRAHYFRERQPLFGVSIAMLATSIGKDMMLDGHLPAPTNLAFHIVFALLAAGAMITSRPRFHEAVAAVMTLLTFSYIGLLFARL